MGGTPSPDSSEDAFNAVLKCHHSNGELYNVTFKRDGITVSSYEADAIVTTIETWADTIPGTGIRLVLISFFEVKEMKIITIAGVVCLVFAAGMLADMVSSSIAVDGIAWVSSALAGDKTYAGHFFTNDRLTIYRDINYQDGIETETRIQSYGPMALDEFSAQVQSDKKNGFTCVFGDSSNRTQYDEISTAGLWSFGSYASARSLDSGLTKAGTRIDGDGMVSLRKISDTQRT